MGWQDLCSATSLNTPRLDYMQVRQALGANTPDQAVACANALVLDFFKYGVETTANSAVWGEGEYHGLERGRIDGFLKTLDVAMASSAKTAALDTNPVDTAESDFFSAAAQALSAKQLREYFSAATASERQSINFASMLVRNADTDPVMKCKASDFAFGVVNMMHRQVEREQEVRESPRWPGDAALTVRPNPTLTQLATLLPALPDSFDFEELVAALQRSENLEPMVWSAAGFTGTRVNSDAPVEGGYSKPVLLHELFDAAMRSTSISARHSMARAFESVGEQIEQLHDPESAAVERDRRLSPMPAVRQLLCAWAIELRKPPPPPSFGPARLPPQDSVPDRDSFVIDPESFEDYYG